MSTIYPHFYAAANNTPPSHPASRPKPIEQLDRPAIRYRKHSQRTRRPIWQSGSPPFRIDSDSLVADPEFKANHTATASHLPLSKACFDTVLPDSAGHRFSATEHAATPW